ncbi:NUDIX hydrolase [Actinoplanes sp. L3-i22]|uniref:NUDIX hydrolase n=1 Tax=Actinoplanes sp. L3-i22 TaxID=2836373 RepID=UPI001C756E38|nr:NUDIX domain-containing protein [Actinoplanes sp. L3-i22]BCY14507.1 DNA mismatch repair protein MutT [Actinoplanes sp. L3-i22]
MTESNQPAIARRAGRVLLVDLAGRALLLHGGDPARPGMRWWFTPGGGLEPGESTVEAAARELFEETGLRVAGPAELGAPIRHERAEFSYNGRDYVQTQDFFLFRVADWQVDTAGMDEEEKLTIIEHRWWSAAEIEASDELIYPVDLAALLRSQQVDGVSGGAHDVPEAGL